MLSRFILSRRLKSLVFSSQYNLRSFASRSGLQEDRTKQVVEDIKRLKYQLESKTKQKSAPFEKVDDQDIAAIYSELAAPIPVRPKISSDYLERLHVKFLDTRSLSGNTVPLLEEGAQENVPSIKNDQTMQDLNVHDFEQLIYANALAKRPLEAQKAFDLIEKYNMTPSIKAVNHLMDAYANVNDLEHVIALFKRLDTLGLKADIYTYGLLVKAFVANQRMDDAFILFEKMKDNSIIPSQPIFSNLISGCLKANQYDKAWQVFDSMRLSYHQPDEVSFTLMLHACAKQGEVERALNLFEDMAGYHLYPTDVTFNVLIHACARRPDYYHEAFSLLDQMQSTYGFQPDKVTFNTLLTACARKKDLKRAREILEWMWKDVEQHGSDSLLSPDHQTYTNLFWCYASYHPTPTTHRVSSVSDTTALSTEHHLLPIQVPHKRSQVVKEAQWLFQQLPSHVQRTSALLTAYLALHISQKQTAPCVDIYTHLFDKCHVQRDGFTFQHMLQLCYRTKDASLAWKVWEDYQDFLENREIQFDLKPNSVSEQKALDIKRHTLATSEGWTETQQQQLAILMANTLGRCDDVRNAIGILSTELRRLALNPPTLRDVMPIYNKCIQLENPEAKQELMHMCTKEQRRTNMKFKRINTTV